VTAPRQILRNSTVLLTRRCSEQRFFLRPSPETNQTFLYVLGVAAERFGILIHAYCALSNHFHCVVTDPDGVLPAFEQYLASLVARACNALHGRWESFWAPGSYSAVRLETQEDVLDKMAYTLANPVIAGLVRRGADWPGPWSSPGAIGGPPLEVSRPEHFFRSVGTILPEVAKLRVVAPPGETPAEELRAKLFERMQSREALAARELGLHGGAFQGAERVLAQSPFARPKGHEPRRGLKPSVACRDRWKRIEALGRLKEFLRAYRDAWSKFASGARDVVFPHGTYWMRVAYGLPCAASG
jgi:hypothetical protein